MKRLSDKDLAEMIGDEFTVDDAHIKRQVRAELKLSQRIPEMPHPTPRHTVLDFHQKTEEQAWRELNDLLNSGARTAHIITGASGILKTKFQDWVKNSIIAPKIISCKVLNNGCFEIKIKKNTKREIL